MTETITILRPGADTDEEDEQGNPIREEDAELESAGWAVAPVTAVESSEPFAQQIIVGYTLYKRHAAVDVVEAAAAEDELA